MQCKISVVVCFSEWTRKQGLEPCILSTAFCVNYKLIQAISVREREELISLEGESDINISTLDSTFIVFCHLKFDIL